MADDLTEYSEYLECVELVELINECETVNNVVKEELDDNVAVGDFSLTEEIHKYGLDSGELCNELGTHDILQCIINIVELEHILKETPKRKSGERRWGVHPINQLRKEYGHVEHLIEEMLLYDHEKSYNFTRMYPARFHFLLSLIEHKITKKAPNAITPKCRLLITLRFLATGDSLKSIHYNFRVGVSTAYNIVYETCVALWETLQPIYMKFPTEQDWIKIAKDFNDKLSFPNCCGAIDGKHIEVVAPKHSGSMYYNYLNYFSTNLLGISDANKKFIYVDIGGYGSQSDGGVFFYSSFGNRMETKNLHLPPPTPLPLTTTPFPHFLIADAAFPLTENLLTPYSKNGMNKNEANYNKEHSSVRKVVENIFAILVKRWMIFVGPIHANPENVDKIVKAAVVLHNFVKSFEDEGAIRYMREDRNNKTPTTEDLISFYESGITFSAINSDSKKAHAVRDAYSNYLANIY